MARRRNKNGKPMSLEECAARMTALLNRRPRNRKTRALLADLPKRSKLIVTPADYSKREALRISFKPEPIRAKIIERGSGDKLVATFVRKDRMRPRAKAKAAAVWACRSEGRHRQPWSNPVGRLARTIDLTMRQRFLLFVAQEGICGLCGEPMAGRPWQFSLDHVIPRSLNGADGLGNLILCHGECNGRKTNDIPTGCEIVWLLAVNVRLGVGPVRP